MKERSQRCQCGTLNSVRQFSFFRPKKFLKYSDYFEGVQEKRCQRYQPDALNSMRTFSLLGLNNFL